MNCKQGEMAIVVKGGKLGDKSPNIGKIVTCKRYAGIGGVRGGEFVTDPAGEPTWEVDCMVEWAGARGGLPYVWDSRLRPLRGNLTEDEEEIVKELYTA